MATNPLIKLADGTTKSYKCGTTLASLRRKFPNCDLLDPTDGAECVEDSFVLEGGVCYDLLVSDLPTRQGRDEPSVARELQSKHALRLYIENAKVTTLHEKIYFFCDFLVATGCLVAPLILPYWWCRECGLEVIQTRQSTRGPVNIFSPITLHLQMQNGEWWRRNLNPAALVPTESTTATATTTATSTTTSTITTTSTTATTATTAANDVQPKRKLPPVKYPKLYGHLGPAGFATFGLDLDTKQGKLYAIEDLVPVADTFLRSPVGSLDESLLVSVAFSPRSMQRQTAILSYVGSGKSKEATYQHFLSLWIRSRKDIAKICQGLIRDNLMRKITLSSGESGFAVVGLEDLEMPQSQETEGEMNQID